MRNVTYLITRDPAAAAMAAQQPVRHAAWNEGYDDFLNNGVYFEKPDWMSVPYWEAYDEGVSAARAEYYDDIEFNWQAHA